MDFWPKVLALCVLINSADGVCTFPTELQGEWLASNMGNVNLTSSELQGYLACKFKDRGICGGVPTTWECHETDGGDQYVLRTPSYTESGSSGRLYMCLYLTRLSSSKYLFYQGPQNDHNSPRLSYVLAVGDGQSDPALTSVCDLTSPFQPTRHHVFIKASDVSSSKSFCPTELLASFSPAANTTGCASDLNSCDTKTDVTVANVTCSPRVLYTDNGSLSCIHSLAGGDVVYVTLYNQDDTTDGTNNYQFACMAIVLENNQIFFNQNPMECDDFLAPNSTMADFTMDPNFWCPVTCTFETSLQGSWLSNRKGELTISTDTLSGFEPYGLDCSTCSGQPSSFECYQQSGSLYLIRSARTFLNNLSVRIYICLDLTFVSSSKYIYYQAHSTTNSELGDYLAVLNGAQPVNSLTEVCTQSTPYPPQLHSVLLTSASPQSGAATCPEQFIKTYNTSVSTCDFTVSACDVDTQLKLSSTACGSSPFYTTGGILSCIYSIVDGSTTYLTLLNHDSSVNGNTTFQFTCMASELDGTNLRFTETPSGCTESQTPTSVNTTDGAEHLLLFLEDCPSSSFPWIIIIGVGAGVLFLVLVALLIYCCCVRRCLAERRAKKKRVDEESIIGSKDEDSVNGADRKDGKGTKTGAKDDRRYSDVFTVDKAANPMTRELQKSKKRRKRRRKKGDKGKAGRSGRSADGSSDNYSSSGSGYTDDFTSDDDSCSSDSSSSSSSEARFRKMFGSRYNLHVALAWSHRENNPELVQDEHEPQTRLFYEREEMLLRQLEAPGAALTSGRSKPLGRIVSTSAVLGPAGWKRRSQRDKTGRSWARPGEPGNKSDAWSDKDGSVAAGKFGRGRPHRLAPIHSVKSLDGTGRKDVSAFQGPFGGLLLPEHMEFLAQYQAYTTTRKLLEDEGFFDNDWDRKKLAGEQFGFNQQELLLNPPEITEKGGNQGEGDFTSEVAEAGQKERQKAGRRVVISAKPASSLVFSDLPGDNSDAKEDGGGTSASEGTASGQKDGNSTGTGGSRSSLANERASSAATATSDLMSRFYARLQELTETKDEDERAASNVDVATRNKDRMRIKTALRRLLNSRLFPDKAKGRVESNGSRGLFSQPDDGSSILFTPGTATPLTVGSRSNIVSRQSRLNAEDGVKPGTRGKVVFVGQSSHLTASSTDTPGYPQEINGDMEGQQQEDETERVAYYRRHPLGPLKTGGISRLYQPVRPPTRSRTSISQVSLQKDGLRGDKVFLQRLQNAQGIRENTRWSLPGERGPDPYPSNPGSGWRRERNPTSAWSYNMVKFPVATDSGQKSPSDPSARNHDWLKDIDDLDLRRLLEELYRDKKYMDRIINTKEANDQTELEVCHRLEDGRDYLLSRAMFWKEKGPLPPRPPTTDLGLRLQRERMMQSRATNERQRESRIEGALSRQETSTSLVKQQKAGMTPSNQETRASPSKPQKTSSPTAEQLTETSNQDSTAENQHENQNRGQERESSPNEHGDGHTKNVSDNERSHDQENTPNPETSGHGDNNVVFNEGEQVSKEHQNPNSEPHDTEQVKNQDRQPSGAETNYQLHSGISREVDLLDHHQQQQQEPTHQEKPYQNVQPHKSQPKEPSYQGENRNHTPASGFQREGSAKKTFEQPKENIFIIAK